jgi:uncharacterized protein involved in exopolysaccharide biosynthesis
MSPAAPLVTLREIVTTLRKQMAWWLVPTVFGTLAAAGHAVLRQPAWRASQALLIRDEAAGSLSRQGRFDNPEAMKTALETIHEIVRSRLVVEAALRKIGPPAHASAEAWPLPAHIEQGQAALDLTAPKGAEFGSTEVIYLAATAPSPDRALEFNAAVCQELDARLRELRNTRAASIIAELQKSVAVAQADLDRATASLQSLEAEVGSDLGELRTLNEQGAGDSNLRTALNQIKEELRLARTNHEANQQHLAHLTSARERPDELLGMPNRLLETQPALQRLKEGLIDAQLRTAEILGKMNERHPVAQAAVASEAQVRQDLRDELESALAGVRADLEISRGLVESLEGQLAEVHSRLDRLAALRAPYSNLAAEVAHRSQILDAARRDLADAQGSQAAAQTASVISLIGEADAGDRPVGPGKTLTTFGGMAGGLAAGLGLVFLRWAPAATRGRRWTDLLPRGRRKGDPREPDRREAGSAIDERRSTHDRRGPG